MANEVRLDLKLTGERQTARGLKEVGDAADQAGTELEGMGKSATVAGKASDKAGSQFDGMADDAGFLKTRIGELDDEIKQLLGSLNATGDTSLEKEIRKSQRELGKYKRFAKELLPDLAPVAAEAGTSVGKSLLKGLSAGLAAAPEVAGPALAGIAISAAPAIGAGISAAVVGGVGAGGILGGVALAAQDPRVKSAGAQLGDAFLSDMQVAATPFVEPVLESLGMFHDAARDIASDLGPGFESLSKSVVPLTRGLIGLANNALPGVVDAMEGARPILDVLGQELPDIGSAIGDFFSIISDDTEGAQTMLRAFLNITEGVIVEGGEFIATVSDIYQGMYELASLLNLIDPTIIGKKFTETSPALHLFGKTADEAAADIETLRQSLSDLFGTDVSAEHSAIAFERALDDLTEAAKENGKTLDINTEKGRQNTEAILTGIEAVKKRTDDEYALALAHGATAAQADNAAKALRDKLGKELEASAIRIFGNTQKVRELLGVLKDLNGSKFTYTIVQKGGVTIGAKVPGGFIPAGVDGRASGGPVSAGRTYIVGEKGPELVTMGGSGHVTNAAQTAALMAQGPSPIPVKVDLTVTYAGPGGPAGDIGEALARWLRFDTKVRGGGDVQVAYGEF